MMETLIIQSEYVLEIRTKNLISKRTKSEQKQNISGTFYERTENIRIS